MRPIAISLRMMKINRVCVNDTECNDMKILWIESINPFTFGRRASPFAFFTETYRDLFNHRTYCINYYIGETEKPRPVRLDSVMRCVKDICLSLAMDRSNETSTSTSREAGISLRVRGYPSSTKVEVGQMIRFRNIRG